jgi:hypothetical protein
MADLLRMKKGSAVGAFLAQPFAGIENVSKDRFFAIVHLTETILRLRTVTSYTLELKCGITNSTGVAKELVTVETIEILKRPATDSVEHGHALVGDFTILAGSNPTRIMSYNLGY